MICNFGMSKTGVQVKQITLRSSALKVSILTLGGIIQDLRLQGVDHPMTLGLKDVAGYEGPCFHFGSLIGPVANRIRGATATIAGQIWNFPAHPIEGLTLHSGPTGFQHQIWQIQEQTTDGVTLSLSRPHDSDHFPGNRNIVLRYQVNDATLQMEVEATSDQLTLMNPANHSYWSLDSDLGIAGQRLTVFADNITETDVDHLATGRVLPLDDGAFDYRQSSLLQAATGPRLDHNFCTGEAKREVRPIAKLEGRDGVVMEMSSTEAGLQVYDAGELIDGGYRNVHGHPYGPFCALALEAQSWPGAERFSNFPSIFLAPGELYHQVTQWHFTQKMRK